MTCRQRTSRVLLVLLLGLGLPACGDGTTVPSPSSGGGAAVQADGEPADGGTVGLKVYRRDLLLAEAERRFGSRQIKASDAAASLASLQDDETFLASFKPRDEEEKDLASVLAKTIAERRLMLGDPPPEAGTVEDEDEEVGEGQAPPMAVGALQEAQRLLQWLRGDPAIPCRVFVRRVDAEGKTLSETPYRWPPPPPPPPSAPEDDAETKPGEATEEPGADEKPTETSGPEDASAGDAAEAPVPEEEAPPPEAAPTAQPELTLKERMVVWAGDVASKEKGLSGKTIVPGECSTVSSLLSMAKAAPEYLPRSGWGLKRFPLATQTPFAYNQPYLELRKLLSTERVAAWKAEAGDQLLIDESTVRERARGAKAFEDQLATTRAERDAILTELDQIVEQVDRWEDVAAVLSGLIQEEQIRLQEAARSDEAAPPEAPSEAVDAPLSPKLRVLEAQESAVSMDVGLIYHTVLRAQERLSLLDALLVFEEGEAHLSRSRYRDYAAELAKVRSERSLRRLQVARQKLVSTQEVLAKEEPKPGSPQAHALEASKALLEMNDIVQRIVERRRRLNEIATSHGSVKAAAPAAVPAVSGDTPPAVPAPCGPEDPVAEESSLHLVTRDIEHQTWALETIANARADLENPALVSSFDADLVARHYDVAARQAKLLATGLDELGDDSALEARFKEVAVIAEKEIKEAGYLGRTRLLSSFNALTRSNRYAVDDLLSEKHRFEDLLAATEAYRQALLDQAARSLSIRVWADVQAGDMVRAVEDSARGVRHAVGWLSGDVKPNVVDWGSSAWRKILLFLAVLVATVGVVLAGRRRIDRWLSARASRIPELRWAGASVRDERRAAQAREKQEAEARRNTEDALQSAAPPEPAPPLERPATDEKGVTS